MDHFLSLYYSKAYLCNIIRRSLILQTRRRRSIILQQSCNYEDGVERGDNNKDKIDKIRE